MKLAFFSAVCNCTAEVSREMETMPDQEEYQDNKNDPVIREIIELERSYFFEKRNVKTERQRKLRDIIERHTKSGDHAE